jgi:hypothetical protein
MEAVCSSETSVDLQRATRRYIPEDSNVHNHHFENLKSYTTILVCICNNVENLDRSASRQQGVRAHLCTLEAYITEMRAVQATTLSYVTLRRLIYRYQHLRGTSYLNLQGTQETLNSDDPECGHEFSSVYADT